MSNSTLRAALTDVFAGTVCSILSIAYCLSYAALIFTGPLEHLLAYGIAVTFLSAAVGGAIVAMRSSLPFAVAGPDSSISVVLAALVATLVQRLPTDGTADLLAPVLIAMALATALTGVLLCVLGFTHAGRAIRFVPYPVIGGFLGATGWLLITGAIQVVTGLRPTLDNVPALADIPAVIKIAPGIVVALMLYALLRRYSKSPFVLPAVLLTALALTHLALLATGTTISAAQDQGWLFRLQPAAGLTRPWQSAALRSFPWSSLPQIAGDGLAVIFVTIANFLLNTTGLEIATRGEANIERDLKVLGLANVVIAALGGYVSCTSFSRSMLVRTAGATSRIAGLTVAAISAAVLVADPAFLGYVPKYILGGLLFYLGADLVYQWLVQSSRRLSPVEYLSLLAIAALIIYAGFIAGVLIGIVIGCATFALSASRVNAIKFSFDGSEYRSSLDRGPYELSLLAGHGREIQGMTLQSYLFFGSANRLYQHVKALLAAQPDCHFLIFDFRLVTGIDSSATHSFTQIKHIADASGARLVLVNLTVLLERAFHTARFISDGVMVVSDLDRALEICEQSIIETHRTAAGHERSLQAWWTDALGAANAGRLAEFCRRREVPAGQIIAREGEPAASMHFILAGRIGIVADMGEGRTMRLRSLGPHTTIGEMGLITGHARSATIAAEADSILYELTAEAYERIKREQPALSQALLGYIVSVMSERLSFANRAVGVLQR
ncbi:MAG: SulP family inorganic anion transporter [Xanthobacteraceae bacterium]